MSETTRMTDEDLREWDNQTPEDVMREAKRARASEDAKDKVIEQLKAGNAGLLLLLTTAERMWSASHDLSDAAHHASMMALRQALTTQLHPGTDLLEELTRLRALHGPDGLCQWHKAFQEEQDRRIKAERQVATLIQGQQSNGEARQRAILDFACELAEMGPPARDAAIRRIIDRSEDKP